MFFDLLVVQFFVEHTAQMVCLHARLYGVTNVLPMGVCCLKGGDGIFGAADGVQQINHWIVVVQHGPLQSSALVGFGAAQGDQKFHAFDVPFERRQLQSPTVVSLWVGHRDKAVHLVHIVAFDGVKKQLGVVFNGHGAENSNWTG